VFDVASTALQRWATALTLGMVLASSAAAQTSSSPKDPAGLAALESAGQVQAPDGPPGEWSFAGVPRITINSDEGFGLGLRGMLFWHRFNQRPYKTAISFQAWATTRLVQHHFIRVDAVDAFNLPVRLEVEAGLFSTLTMPFCGDPPPTGFGDDGCIDSDDTRLRSVEPYGLTNARFRLLKQPFFKDTLKVEAFVGWRGTQYIPGSLFDDDGDGTSDLFPYPGSRYALQFPNGEPGFASVAQAGVAVDTRDDEPNPTRGFFFDASVRSSQPAWGSAFSFVGGNVTARIYAPLVPSRTFVVTERVIVDGVVGDAPWRERVRLGGLVESSGIGGLDVGRGIRLARYPGRLRLSLQHELRATPVTLDVFGNTLALPVALFLDTGAALFDDGAPPRLLVGGGVSFRVVWNKTFVMRLDLAVSPEEPGRLAAYSAPNHPW
jgi:hypothetical protein